MYFSLNRETDLYCVCYFGNILQCEKQNKATSQTLRAEIRMGEERGEKRSARERLSLKEVKGVWRYRADSLQRGGRGVIPCPVPRSKED